MSNGAVAQLQVIDKIADEYGFQVRVYDHMDDNGFYLGGSNVIHVALDAEEGMIGRASSHELFHYIKSTGGEAATKLQNYILNALKNTEGYDYEGRIAQIMDGYAEDEGQKLGREAAEEEMAAEGMLDVFDTEENLRGLFSEVQDKSLLEKIRDWLTNTARKIKDAMDRLAWNHPEVRALKDNYEYIKGKADLVKAALEEAQNNYLASQRGLYSEAAADPDVKAYQKAMENAFTDEDAQAERDTLAKNLFMRAEKGWIEQHADLYEDGLEKFKQALRDYGTGKVALNKALRDQGLEDAPADMNAALAYAGRQLENEGKIQNIHFSIKKNQDGINYVEVDTDQDIFAGKTADEMPSILQKYIKNRFMGKTIGTTNNRAYINSRSAGEYSHPAKSYDNQVYEAKLRTGTELDNMMDAAVFIEHTDADERHPEFPNGWDKYKAAIHVNNKWYIASISVGIDNRMRRRFYEANFKEMESTDTAFGSVRFITPPNSISASDNNISQNKGGVKIKSSKNGAAGQTGQGNRRYLSDEEESGIKFSRRADTDQRREDQALESVRDDPELYSQMMDGMQSLSALMTLQRLYRMTTAGEETAIKQGAFESRLSGIADGIIEKTGTKYGKRKLMAALRKVYTAMEQSGYNIGEVLQYTRSVTRDVLEASPGVLVEQDETTKEIIKELKNSKYYLSNDQKIEIRKAYGNVVNYIRKNYGRVGVAKKGADTKSLAEFWRETLTPLNPAVFAEDANGLDMPGILDAWLETANEKKYEGEYGANIGNYATDLALNAMLDFYDSSDTLKAVQDNRQEQIRQLTEMARNAVITAREEYEQRYLKRIAKAQERREATERKQTLRAKITRDVKAINALNVKQNDTSHVPEEMRAAALEAVRPFLAGSGVFTTGEMIRLSNTYNLLRERAGEIGGFDEDILATINGLSDRLNGRRLSELTGQELQDLSDIMGNIRKMIADANEAFVAGRKTTIDALSSQLKEDMREKKQVNTGKLASLARALQMRESTPVYFADRVGGVVQEMIGDFFQGQDTWAFTMDKVKKYMQQQLDKYHVKEWIDDGKHARFVTQHGDQIELNKEEALSLYALWKRETSNKLQNANHLRVGGFMYQKGTKYEGVDTLRPHPLTASDMHMIENYLTDEQKAFADEMVKYLSEDMSKIGNDVSMRLYGYEKFKEPYYFPYETDHRFLVGDLTQTGEQIKQPKSAGMTKQLMQNAATPITVGEFTTTWAKHINQMGLYAGFAESVDTMSRVLNHREAGEVMLDSVTGEEYVVSPESNWIELERAIGAEGVQYLKTLVRDISGGVRADERGPIAKGLSMFKKGSVLGNVSVVLQQPTAYARAMAVMSPQYLLSSNPARLAQDIRNMYKYSGVALIKQMGKFDTGTGKGAIEWMTEDVHKGNFGERALGAVDKIAGIGAEKADEWTWGLLWGAVEKETKHNRADLKAGSEEFYQAVAERFEDVVNHTQVYDSVLSRSEWMRSNTTMDKMVTSFMAEPTLTFNMLMDAMTSGENAGRGKRIARAAGTFAVNSLLVALAKSIATATRRKKDEGRTWLEKYVAEGAGNFLDEISPFGLISMIPWARDVVSIFEGYDVERSDMDAVTQIKKGFDTLTKYLNGGDISLEDTLQGTLGPIANLFGIPLKNLWRDTEAVVRNLFGGASANEPTTARDLKYSVLENPKMGPFSLYDSGNKAYYDRMEQALLSGDTAKYDELRGYLEETKQVKPGTIDNGIKNEIKGSVMGGLISDDRAISILQGSFGMTHDKAWETVEKWVQQAEHAEDEDYNYTKYGEIMDLVKDGQDISAAVKKLTDNTKTGENSIRSEIKSKIGEWYRDGELTKQQAEDRLKKYLNMTDPDELHWQFDEWEYMQKDTGDSYSRYVDVFDAVKNGKDLKAAMKEMTDNGYAEKDVRSKIKSQIGDWYKKGELTSAQAQQKLKTYAQITDANDLYWTMDQLDYEKANPKGQYKKYNAYYKAIETGTNLQKETKRYLEHGVDKSTLTRQITSNFKPQYLDLLAKGKKNEATALKARLLNAYEALGYDRGKKQKDIDKWTK
ncbi:MAG: hypothetical protein IKP72_15310 [Clostridia bacterium]|nr:hypothetical protein [Clostridia bacterium]